MAQSDVMTAPPVVTRRRAGRRAGAGVLDQLLYSFTNFALTVLVARSVSAQGFGAYSLVIATYLVAIAVLRGLTSETLIVRFSASDLHGWRQASIDATGAVTCLGLAVGAAMVASMALVSGTVASSLLAVGVLFPGLALQDFLRFAAIARGRPALALANDLTQAVVQFAITGYLLTRAHPAPWEFIAAWGIGAHVGAVVGLVSLALPLRPDRALRWFGNHGRTAGRYAVDDLAGQGSQQATSYVLAAVANLAEVGALRGAQTVFNPPSILNLGVQSAVTPELVRIKERSVRQMRRQVMQLSVALALVGAVWGAVALLIPASVGRGLFGETWQSARPLLIYFTFAQAANGFRVGPMAGLRAMAAANRTLSARFVVIVIGLLFQLVGAVVAGVHGVAVAVAVGTPLQAAAWWWNFEAAVKGGARHRQPPQSQAKARVAKAKVWKPKGYSDRLNDT